jgi:hypothetical protein
MNKLISVASRALSVLGACWRTLTILAAEILHSPMQETQPAHHSTLRQLQTDPPVSRSL